MNDAFSDLLKTKILILSLSVSMADIAAERWEKGQEDPQWVTRSEDGRFSKSSGSIGESADELDNIETNIFNKIANSASKKTLELAKIANKSINKLTNLEKALIVQTLQPSITETFQAIKNKLKQIDKSILDGFEKAESLILDSIKTAEDKISAYIKSTKDKAVGVIKDLNNFDYEEVLEPILEYINSSSDVKNLLQKIGMVAAFASLIGISVAATNAVTSGLLMVGLAPNFAAKLLMIHAFSQGFLTAGFRDVIKTINNWQTEVTVYDTSLNPKNKDSSKKDEPSFSEALEKVSKAIQSQFRGGKERTQDEIIAKELKVSKKQSSQILSVTSELGINTNALINTIKKQKMLEKEFEKIDSLRKQIGKPVLTRHTLKDRLLELTDLTEKRGKALLEGESVEDIDTGIEWRKGIIESEIKYGDLLTELITTPPSSDGILILNASYKNVGASFKKAYSNLIQAIEQGKNNSSKISELESLRKLIAGLPTNLSGYLQQRVSNAVKDGNDFTKLINQDLSVKVDYETERGFHTDVTQFSHTKLAFLSTKSFLVAYGAETLINIGSIGETRSTMWHELGHALEAKAQLSKYTYDYIKNRTISKEMFKLKTVDSFYGENELAYTTDLTDPYMGKVYKYQNTDTPYNSELISMGTQALNNVYEANELASNDRDHLLFTLWALDRRKEDND